MNSISNFGAFDALAHLGQAGVSAPAAATRTGAWFDGAGSEAIGSVLRAEVQPGARGLNVAQHAGRVLGHLLVEPPNLASG